MGAEGLSVMAGRGWFILVLLGTWCFGRPGYGQSVSFHALFESDAHLSPRGKVDQPVFAQAAPAGNSAGLHLFGRGVLARVYLDVIGTLPTAEEAAHFLADSNPRKRRDLVEALLEREEFAEYWALKWGDLLRVKAEFPINLWPNAVQAYHRWIRTSIRGNMRYDEFVGQLLCSSGSNFRDPQVNFYRSLQSKDPEAIAQAVALTFMGTRAEKWPREQLEGMARFFSHIGYKRTGEWKEEIVFFDSRKLWEAGPQTAVFPDGTTVELTADTDPREVFTQWLISPQNPWFARAVRQPCLVLALGARDRARAGRYAAGQSAESSSIAGHAGKRTLHGPVRHAQHCFA